MIFLQMAILCKAILLHKLSAHFHLFVIANFADEETICENLKVGKRNISANANESVQYLDDTCASGNRRWLHAKLTIVSFCMIAGCTSKTKVSKVKQTFILISRIFMLSSDHIYYCRLSSLFPYTCEPMSTFIATSPGPDYFLQPTSVCQR